MFFITRRMDSGIDMPDLEITDEKFLQKYGSDLTANFADIKAYAAKAFFQKQNLSTGSTYSLCACATGYIWVGVTPVNIDTPVCIDTEGFSDLKIQIGAFPLKTGDITTREIEFKYKYSLHPYAGQLALLFSTVLANYLQLRIMGQQFEGAAESAIKLTCKDLSRHTVVNPGRFGNFESLLREVCTNAPMPPISDVSLISRSMITRRWECWRDQSVLRQRYFLPRRVLRCFRSSRYDSIDLLSGTFKTLTAKK